MALLDDLSGQLKGGFAGVTLEVRIERVDMNDRGCTVALVEPASGG